MKYQRKMKRELAELYQSNDPMHWVYLSAKLGNTNRLMTDRERRIFMRRLTRTFKGVADTIKRMFDELPKMVTKVASSVAALADAFNKNPQMQSPLLKTHISIAPIPDNLSGDIMSRRLIGELAVKPITMPNMHIGTIIVDEAMHLDDDTIESVNKLVEKGKNGG